MLFVFDDQFGDGVADCEAASDAVVPEVGVLPQVGVATLIAGQALIPGPFSSALEHRTALTAVSRSWYHLSN